MISGVYIVPGLPHPLLAPQANPGYQRLKDAFDKVRAEIHASDAELILTFSTQWLSVLGYLFQADPNPEWTLVDHNWHELGSMPYRLRVDAEFAKHAAEQAREMGFDTKLVAYKGFPIDTGTVVSQLLLNPDRRLPAAMVSCNMYAEKQETLSIGQAMMRAIEKRGLKTAVVLVSGLSSRFHTDDIPFAKDRISSLKDEEWNFKLLELLGEGRLEDVSEVGREFSRQANADMGFRGFWFVNGLCGKTNSFRGRVHAYEPVYGTGAAVVSLSPTAAIRSLPGWVNDEADLVERIDGQNAMTRNLKGEASPNARVVSRAASSSSQASSAAPGSSSAWTRSLDSEGSSTDSGSVRGQAQGTMSKGVSTDKAAPPVGPYPHSRVEGDLVYLSGVGPRRPGQRDIPGVQLNSQGEIVSYDVERQTHSVFENITAILAEHGLGLDDVIDVQAYLTDMKSDFKTFNRVYGEYFGRNGLDHAPCRTTIEVGALPTPIAVEMKVLARRRG
jgi:2-aminophenol/2-amino-5-chlorophenol 1,6-dioxygenase alpha subunit